jgi:hypothetical protein
VGTSSDGHRAVDVSAGALLETVATALERANVPLAAEFGEMLRVDAALEPSHSAPTQAAAELMLAPMTVAESVAGLVLRDVVVHVRDVRADDELLEPLMTLAALYASRFETYLAERAARDHLRR